MDDPDCDPVALGRTYAAFRTVNRLVAGWRGLYRHRIRPLLAAGTETTLLDVGCGGADVARALTGWAARDGLRLRVTGIDPDPRAYAFASAGPPLTGLTVRCCDTRTLVGEGRPFDLVISNHLVHHLDAAALAGLLADSRALATRLVLHSDLARSPVAYAAFAALSIPLGFGSFVRVDGLRSIRRSYRPGELAAAAGDGWRVEARFPYRLLLSWAGSDG